MKISQEAKDAAQYYVRAPVGFIDGEYPDRCSFDHAGLSAAFQSIINSTIDMAAMVAIKTDFGISPTGDDRAHAIASAIRQLKEV